MLLKGITTPALAGGARAGVVIQPSSTDSHLLSNKRSTICLANRVDKKGAAIAAPLLIVLYLRFVVLFVFTLAFTFIFVFILAIALILLGCGIF